ncbi:MAG: hypothetical protein ACOC2D_00860 [Spirochaetota bacterium]
MKEADAVRAVGRLREQAEAATRTMGEPDVDALVDAATVRGEQAGHGDAFGSHAVRFVPAIAATAAIAVVVLALRLLVPWGSATATPADPPEHLVTFVDSLYDEGAGAYLDDVWTDVLDDLAAADD